ncbi:MAG TPA: hypothetical protein VIL77_06260 [Gaiellaceae bacterium]
MSGAIDCGVEDEDAGEFARFAWAADWAVATFAVERGELGAVLEPETDAAVRAALGRPGD